MLIRKAILVLVVILLITLAGAGSVSSGPGSVMYWRSFDLDGLIAIKALAENGLSGVEHKTLIQGKGALQRTDWLAMIDDQIAVKNDSQWQADPDSLLGLAVASSSFFPVDGIPAQEVPQVFAVSVKAERGESGQLSQDLSAAMAVYGDQDYHDFSIEQSLATSGGTVKRYIDLANPVNGLRLFEESTINGSAAITDQLGPAVEYPVQDELEIEPDEQWFMLSNEEIEEEAIFYLDSSEQLFTYLPLGSSLDQVPFPVELEIALGPIHLSGLPVAWQQESSPSFNGSEPGAYLFTGEMLLPDQIVFPNRVMIFYVVYLVDENSDHFEDLVHGREDGVDQETDEETDHQ